MLKKSKFSSAKPKTPPKKNVGGAGDGVFYDKRGHSWGYRIARDGKDIRKQGFATKTEAKEARIKALAESQEAVSKRTDEDTSVTMEEIYTHYRDFGSTDKREATLRKQDSLWNNHIKDKFGHRPLISISVGELSQFLSDLYEYGSNHNNPRKKELQKDEYEGYAYSYVEGFLKLFYLIYGYARKQFWISRDTYCLMCEDKGIRLTMPPKTQEDIDEETIETYTQEEINRMAERLKSTGLYTAFLMGYYLGLRISECFSTRWCDISWKEHTIKIHNQLLMQSPHRVIAPCKTLAANREIDIPDVLYEHLKEKYNEQKENAKYYGTSYRATETVKIRMGKGPGTDLVGGDFINRQKNGQLLTTDSMKSWSVKIKDELGIHFKYHNLRHTHASYLAALNVPMPKLQERLGHKKISTTSKYYFGRNEIADDFMKKAINQL